MKKTVARIVCFILILVIILGYVNKVFKVKYSDGIYGVTKFYELEDDTVDVLFLGSSHAFEDFNTGTLWNEYGMASYILAGSIQPMWNTYYYLKEALKTQTPEVIVLEGYLTTYESEFIDDSRIIKNNYGLHWSKDKVDSIKISSPEERWTEFLLEYIQYHTRYSELSAADFLSNQNNRLYDDWKGFGCNMATTPLESIDIGDVTDRVELYEKTEKYYRATIELAQENDIPIVVVISPYAGITKYQQQKYNTAGDIAAEYGVPFINCNLLTEEIGLDYTTDVADIGHLNYKGNQKYSSYIGKYLKENFEISDRRNDSGYDSWQRNADYIEQMIEDQKLRECQDINQIAELIQDSNYWVFISVDGNCNTSDENLQNFFASLGIAEEGASGIWYKKGRWMDWYSQMGEADKYIQTSARDFCMRRTADDDEVYSNSIIIDNTKYMKVKNGVNMVIYDTLTEKVVDTIGLNADDGYNIVR